MKNLNNNFIKAVIFLIMATLSVSANGQEKYSCGTEGNAFNGYDLVSYFQSAPKKGVEKYSVDHDNLHLLFSSQENLETFKANPWKYVPAYGGWCATAVANGTLVRPDYSMYQIQNDNLIFFEVKAFFNGQAHWNRNPEANEALANDKFHSLLKNE